MSDSFEPSVKRTRTLFEGSTLEEGHVQNRLASSPPNATAAASSESDALGSPPASTNTSELTTQIVPSTPKTHIITVAATTPAAPRARFDHFNSSIKVMNVMEKRFEKQKNELTEVIDQKFSSLKIKDEMAIQTATIKEMIDGVKTSLLAVINEKFSKLNDDINAISLRVSNVEKKQGEIDDLKNEIKVLKIQSLKHSNSLVACDLRINGIPYARNENLYNHFDSICKTINIQTPPVQSIHRLQNKNNKDKQFSPDAVIIVKLLSPYDKNFVLKSLNAYKKINKNNLMINIFGFTSNENFYINEHLTNTNYKILRAAVRMKKDKRCYAAYSFRGLVYVKCTETDKPVCIESTEALEELFHLYEGLSHYNQTERT